MEKELKRRYRDKRKNCRSWYEIRREKVNIELSVDGRKIPMNDFVQKIIVNVIKAMVETLHTIDGGWNEISIHIEKDDVKK